MLEEFTEYRHIIKLRLLPTSNSSNNILNNSNSRAMATATSTLGPCISKLLRIASPS